MSTTDTTGPFGPDDEHPRSADWKLKDLVRDAICLKHLCDGGSNDSA